MAFGVLGPASLPPLPPKPAHRPHSCIRSAGQRLNAVMARSHEEMPLAGLASSSCKLDM